MVLQPQYAIVYIFYVVYAVTTIIITVKAIVGSDDRLYNTVAATLLWALAITIYIIVVIVFKQSLL